MQKIVRHAWHVSSDLADRQLEQLSEQNDEIKHTHFAFAILAASAVNFGSAQTYTFIVVKNSW